MFRSAFFCDLPDIFNQVFGYGRREELESVSDFYPEIISEKNVSESLKHIRSIEHIFTTWGMPKLTEPQIDSLKNLKIIFYAAGSVRNFARPFLERGIKICSAWIANGIPVAEFTLAQILLAAKGFHFTERKCRTPKGRNEFKPFKSIFPGIYDIYVSILGFGTIGRKTAELLKNHNVRILVYDPFLSEDEAFSEGVEPVSLTEAFEKGFIISNHIPDIPSTKKMLTGELFERMQQYSTFINTGRGETIDEEAMLSVLQKRQDITAILDVTDPEPPLENSLIYQLENVILTPHIAGSTGQETVRLADFMIEEFERYKNGEPLKYSITLEKLENMA